MTTVKITCPDCGEVAVHGHNVAALAYPRQPLLSTLQFLCPGCNAQVTKPASPETIDLLISAGIRVETCEYPAELDEPRTGPRLTKDDLVEFALHLGVHEYLSTVADLETQR